MYRIAIVDDEQVICSQLEKIILEYQKQLTIKMEISVFLSGEELCAALDDGMEIDLLFLDIELYEINGIEVSKKIREQMQNHQMQIVFISAKEKYALDLFAVQPFNFLLKPLKPEVIIKNLDLVLSIAQKQASSFVYKAGTESRKLPLKDIIYLESDNRKVIIHTRTGEDEFYGKLEDIYAKLATQRFLFIHKSIIVNYNYVAKFSYNDVLLLNGKTLPISQSRRPEIRQQVTELEAEGIISWK